MDQFSGGRSKLLRTTLGERDELAVPVLDADGKQIDDTSLRYFEYVPLKNNIDAFFESEIKPHIPDAYMDRSKDRVGYKIGFTQYFFEYQTLRSTNEIAAELELVINQTKNLIHQIVEAQ